MATKKDAYYFSHDANSQDDPKCMILIDQLGMEGYGIFWALIEKLRAEKEYKLPLLVCASFARRWGTSKEKVEAVVLKYNLFRIEDDEFFYSERLKNSMELKSLKATESISKRWNNTNVLQANTSVLRKDTIKVKESKVKESNRRVIIPVRPDYFEFENFALEKEPLINKQSLKLKYDSWIENGWKNGNDKPIKNWKSALLNTIPYIAKESIKTEPKYKHLTKEEKQKNNLDFNRDFIWWDGTTRMISTDDKGKYIFHIDKRIYL